MDIYTLNRNFVDFSFENPSKIKPNHYALYFFSIEHCNRLGWKKEFGLPTTMTMEAIGIKSYKTYINTFNELVDYGFFKLIERSKNQYSSNIIELVLNDKAHTKALDKAFIKHASKQVQSTGESIDSINKPIYNIPIDKSTTTEDEGFDFLELVKGYAKEIGNGQSSEWIAGLYMACNLKDNALAKLVQMFNVHLMVEFNGKWNKDFLEYRKHCGRWIRQQHRLGKIQEYTKDKAKGTI